jgi:hypothetical protein
LWEAFLLQMNDFDQLLELQLRRMLDPVVARRPPVRRGRIKRTPEAILTVKTAVIELVADAIPVGEPVAVAIPVAGAPRL